MIWDNVEYLIGNLYTKHVAPSTSHVYRIFICMFFFFRLFSYLKLKYKCNEEFPHENCAVNRCASIEWGK